MQQEQQQQLMMMKTMRMKQDEMQAEQGQGQGQGQQEGVCRITSRDPPCRHNPAVFLTRIDLGQYSRSRAGVLVDLRSGFETESERMQTPFLSPATCCSSCSRSSCRLPLPILLHHHMLLLLMILILLHLMRLLLLLPCCVSSRSPSRASCFFMLLLLLHLLHLMPLPLTT